jgi:hypothetical protein
VVRRPQQWVLIWLITVCIEFGDYSRLFKSIDTKMHFKNALLTAALSAYAAADFLVITDYPQALQTLSPEQVC